jgi:hypothetical protein
LKIAIKALWRRWTRGVNFGRVAGEGMIEFANRRYVLDYGEFTEVNHDGDTGGVFHGPSAGDLWWLLDLLRGITEADDEGDELIRGTPCRRLATRVDLSVASAASRAGLSPPTVQRFEELLALPLTVWVDDSHVRRVRFSELEGRSARTLELWDFGVDTGTIDWSPRMVGSEGR